MGGGTALRSAAAKVAGIGSGIPGLRGIPASATSQSLRNAAAGRANAPPSATLSAQGGEVAPAAVQRNQWNIDDWEKVAVEVEKGSGEPMPRVVFGGAPSFEEAKAATNELKDAIDQVYLSKPNTDGLVDPVPKSVESDLSTIGSGTTITYAVPNHAAQAFKLLSQSPAAQNVVASIASDPNVWNALLQNDDLKGFMLSHKSEGIQFPLMDPKLEESVDDAASEVWKSPRKFEELSDDSNSDHHKNPFIVMLENVKLTVVEMMSSISSYLQNIFNPPASEKATASDSNTGSTFNERTLGASLMGLALMVVMVVVLKRV